MEISKAFLHIPFMILAFYGNGLWLQPKLFKAGNWRRYFLSVMAGFILIVLLNYIAFKWLNVVGYGPAIDWLDFLKTLTWTYFLAILVSFGWSFAKSLKTFIK